MKDIDKKTKAYALKNALAYDGKAQQGAVISSLFHEGLKKEKLKDHIKEISKIISDVNKLSLQEQTKEYEELKELVSERPSREGLEELPNVKRSGVVMRFAPSASGPLHIGHALTAALSYLYVKKYGGKFYIRIEDTNPENIYPLAYKMIKEEADWLFEKSAKIIIQSERMEIYYKYAETLLKKNAVYVCTCKSEDFKKLVDSQKACPCRNNSAKENLSRWQKMLDKSSKGYKDGDAVLRFKSDLNDKNPAMRDFPLARINTENHVLQKKKYKVWPLMNLAVAVDDIEEGMTHIIRGKDHRDNALRQKKIYDALGKSKSYPWIGFLGRIHFKDMELSTSKMRQEIEQGKYSGWDDKGLFTIASLKKQGYKPEAFHKLAEHIGLSEVDKTFDKKEFFRLLDTFSKD